MADNNFVETNSQGDNRLPSNPYAQKGGLEPKIAKIDYCNYLASVGYSATQGAGTIVITPLTGNTAADLLYYRIEIKDQSGNTIVGELDLNNRTNTFAISTNPLNASDDWTLYFYGAVASDHNGDAPCGLQYKKHLGNIGVTGGSGNTIPGLDVWNNVTAVLKLTSTDDGTFDFPTEGIEVQNGDNINLSLYSSNEFITQGDSYVFSLELKKIGTNPVAASPTPTSDDAIASFTTPVTYPYAISKNYVTAVAAITLDTSASGGSGSLTFALTDEGVIPSFTVNIETDVQ